MIAKQKPDRERIHPITILLIAYAVTLLGILGIAYFLMKL